MRMFLQNQAGSNILLKMKNSPGENGLYFSIYSVFSASLLASSHILRPIKISSLKKPPGLAVFNYPHQPR